MYSALSESNAEMIVIDDFARKDGLPEASDGAEHVEREGTEGGDVEFGGGPPGERASRAARAECGPPAEHNEGAVPRLEQSAARRSGAPRAAQELRRVRAVRPHAELRASDWPRRAALPGGGRHDDEEYFRVARRRRSAAQHEAERRERLGPQEPIR